LNDGFGNAYFLEGDEVYARTTAIGTCTDEFNVYLRSAPAYDETPVTLRAGASTINDPWASPKSDYEVEVCWNQPNADGTYQYTLLWSNVENYYSTAFNRVQIYGQADATGELCHDLRTDPSSSQYTFKIIAENDCSYVESDYYVLPVAKVPEQPVCRTEVVDCDMEITWNAVGGRGSPVTRYNIEI